MICPDCGNLEAECIIGNYWKCPNPSCSNGPEPKDVEFELDEDDTQPIVFRWKVLEDVLNQTITNHHRIILLIGTPGFVADWRGL